MNPVYYTGKVPTLGYSLHQMHAIIQHSAEMFMFLEGLFVADRNIDDLAQLAESLRNKIRGQE